VLVQQAGDQLHQPALVGDRGVAAGQLLHYHGIGDRVAAGSPNFGRNGDAEQAELGHFGVDLGRKPLLGVEPAGGRPDLAVGEAPRRLLDPPMVVGQQHVSGPACR
jgi:hypothetical protein